MLVTMNKSMGKLHRLFCAFVGLSFALSTAMLSQTPAKSDSATDWKPVEAALGRSGKLQPGDIYKFGMPRTDMHVTVGGVTIKAPLALGSWVAFHKMGTDAMALTGTPVPSTAAPAAQALTIDADAIGKALGSKGAVNGGVLQFSVPRAEKITDEGMEIPPSMGTASAINFQPTGQGRAAITGDFVLIASEVNPVIRALRENGILVTAVHSHMLTEQPRLFFLHFWANDDALKLAHGLSAALGKTNSAKTAAK